MAAVLSLRGTVGSEALVICAGYGGDLGLTASVSFSFCLRSVSFLKTVSDVPVWRLPTGMLKAGPAGLIPVLPVLALHRFGLGVGSFTSVSPQLTPSRHRVRGGASFEGGLTFEYFCVGREGFSAVAKLLFRIF